MDRTDEPLPEELLFPCYTFGFHPPLQHAVKNFASGTFHRCWMFCKHYKHCITFTFTSTGPGRCLLFPEREEQMVRGVTVGTVTANKYCMMGRKCGGVANSLDQLERFSYRDRGYYIWNRKTAKCLAANVVESTRKVGNNVDTNSRQKTGKHFMLKWKKCTHRQIQKWVIQLKGRPTTYPPDPMKPWPRITSSRVIISTAEPKNEFLRGRRICLTWQNEGLKLKKCNLNITGHYMSLIYKKFPYQVCQISLADYGPGAPDTHIPIELRTTLPKNEEQYEEILWKKPCRLKNSSISNGYLLEGPEIPFQLPNEDFTVRCVKDYTVNELDNSDEFSMPCTRNMKLMTCVKQPEPSVPATYPLHITLVLYFNFLHVFDNIITMIMLPSRSLPPCLHPCLLLPTSA